MDTQVKSISWIGNICEKFEAFYSEIDDIIKQDLQKAENQFLTAGANVKQFCSEFMEELLPESIVNSLQGQTTPFENEKCVVQAVLDKEANGGNTQGFSDSDSNSSHLSFPIENAEELHADSACLKANDRKEMCFEQNHVREKKPPSEVLQGDGEYDSEHDFQNPTHADSQSSYSPAKAGDTSDPVPAADVKSEPSTVYQLANSVSAGSNDCQLLENEMSSSGHNLSRESFDINDGSDCQKAEESKDNCATVVGLDVVQPFSAEKIEDSCLVDSNELHSASNMPEQHRTFKRTVCKFCLTMKFGKECKCRQAASFKDNAQSIQTEGKFLSQAFLTGESESALDRDFCESDWVII